MITRIILVSLVLSSSPLKLFNVFSRDLNEQINSFMVKYKKINNKEEIINDFKHYNWVSEIDLLESSKKEISTFLLNTNNKEKAIEFLSSFNKIKSFYEDVETKDSLTYEFNNKGEILKTFKANSYRRWITDINLDKAWTIRKDASNVRVGVIDGGIYGDHPDLTNSINRSLSKSFVFGSNSPLEDERGHGTSVAGIIAATHNNNNSYGVCSNVDLVSLKTSINNSYTISDLCRAINYAESIDCDIINMSLGFYDHNYGTYLEESIRNFSGLVVCAAGNENNNLDIKPIYPACLDLDNIISVGATNYIDYPEEKNNYSDSEIDIFAPGASMYLLENDGGEALSSTTGYTSYATPIISGIAALYLADNLNTSTEVLKNRIMISVDKLSQFKNQCLSEGRITAFKVLHKNHQYYYEWLNLKQHEVLCAECDYSAVLGHMVSSGDFSSGNKYATCLLCGGRAEMGLVINPHSYNNSFKTALINGLLVLSEDDYEKFLKGELYEQEIFSYFNN